VGVGMANAKKTVDAWNVKCEKAERALDRAVKRWNKAPDDATEEQLNKLSKTMRNAQGKLQELYMNLPYCLDDVAGEYYAQLRVAEMVASGEVTPRKMKQITSEQVAEVVNRYLSMRHGLVIAEYEHRFNRHEWEIQTTAGYSAPHEHISSHNEILGRIWVEPKRKEGEVTGWTMGYGLAKGELQLGDKFRLATEFRGAVRAVDNEFHLSKKWDDFMPEPRKPDGKFSGYGREGGRPSKASYDRAYHRIMNDGMSRKEAFGHYLEEEGMRGVSKKLRGEKWRQFRKSMGYRKAK